MPSDKEKLLEGIRFLAVALPLIFMGPAVYFIAGVPALNKGNYLWLIFSVLIMIIAVVLAVLGIKRLLAGFFND